MKKNVFGKKFNRDTNERRALFKSLISALVLNERIQTTETKAKAIKGETEKAVTRVKKNGKFAKRFLGDILVPLAVEKLINDIAPRFKNRQGGYTRIIRVGRRFGDNAMEVVMEWTEGKSAVASTVTKSTRKPKTKTRSIKKTIKPARKPVSRTKKKLK